MRPTTALLLTLALVLTACSAPTTPPPTRWPPTTPPPPRREVEYADQWHDGSVLVDCVAIPARKLMHVDTGVAVLLFDLDGPPVMVVVEGMATGSVDLVGVADPLALLEEFETRRRRLFN